MKKVCLVASSPFFVEVFLLDQLDKLSKIYEVTLLANTNEADFLTKHNIQVKVIGAPIERKIHLWRDISALVFLVNIFRRHPFDLVHSFTPKTGLLTMIAAAITGVPVRIHTFTGQVWQTCSGFKRFTLKMADRLTAGIATHVLADSFTQLDFLIDEKVAPKEKSAVLAKGSISGVNVARFKPDPGLRKQFRRQHNLPQDALVFLYMSRLTRDKGALAMAEAFSRFSKNESSAHLLIVGPDEEGLIPRITDICRQCFERVHFFDVTSSPVEYMAAADIFCLPSYREGFGSVLIDAAAVGIPSIASRIYGSVEAVVEGVTGLLHEAGDISDMVDKMNALAADPKLRSTMGTNGRRRVVDDFREEMLTSALLEFYTTACRTIRAR